MSEISTPINEKELANNLILVPHHIEWVNHFWYGRFSFNVPLIINC